MGSGGLPVLVATPVMVIPDTSNITAAALLQSPKHVGDTKKMADRPVTIVDTLQHTLLVQPEVRSVETALRHNQKIYRKTTGHSPTTDKCIKILTLFS